MNNIFVFRFVRRLFPVICLLIGVACTGGNRQQPSAALSSVNDSSMVECAQGFTMHKLGKVTLLTVFNPWQGAQDVVYRYALCPKDEPIPEGLSDYTLIRTPVERVICLSTTHVAMLSAIGKTASIKALSGAAYISDPEVNRAIANGEIPDIGYHQSLNFEKIIALKPDVIFAYGVGQEVSGLLTRLTDLGLTVALNAEYLERTALGKSEWIKFMSAFYTCEDQAAQLFHQIKQNYDSLTLLAAGRPQKPTVICGLPWQGSWYIPGGHTSTASMIADAGGDYLWKNNESHESYPVNIEAIVDKGSTADLWINTGAARSLAEILSVDERLSIVQAWQTGRVYNNYARVSAGGGNDFFESGVVRPDIVLKDLIKIFHPDLLPDHSFYYYLPLD
jgi:iron complex transport system substrate-binding protein